jgi:hypothetical protein
MDMIEKSAHQYNQPDTLYGYGIPNFELAYIILGEKIKNTEKKNLSVCYPNPFSNSLTLELYSGDGTLITDHKELIAEIFDTRGNKVWINHKDLGGDFNPYPVLQGLESITPGIYIVKVTSLNRTYHLKAIKSR